MVYIIKSLEKIDKTFPIVMGIQISKNLYCYLKYIKMNEGLKQLLKNMGKTYLTLLRFFLVGPCKSFCHVCTK